VERYHKAGQKGGEPFDVLVSRVSGGRTFPSDVSANAAAFTSVPALLLPSITQQHQRCQKAAAATTT